MTEFARATEPSDGPRALAIVELMRAVPAFMIAPVFAYDATIGTYGGTGIAYSPPPGAAVRERTERAVAEVRS